MRDYILALIAAIGSVLSSVAAVKIIVRHEAKMCEKRLEAFREGLDRGEKSR
jgi:hypothetical protein